MLRSLCLFLVFLALPAFARSERPIEDSPAASRNDAARPPEKSESERFFLFREKEIDVFPVPIFQTRPDEKETYGAMPVLLLSDEKTHAIQTIVAALLQYNSIIKFNGAAVLHHYPDPNKNADEVYQLYFQMAQKYYRELQLRYFNPRFKDKFYVEGNFQWLKTPFRRFFGYGADSAEGAESNYVSRNFYFTGTVGYRLPRNFRVNFTEQFVTTDLLTRAVTDVADTLALYGATPGVYDATNFIHRFSATYDTRPSLSNSREGFFAEAGGFFSLRGFGSDATLYGFSAEAIHLHSMFSERTTIVLRAYLQDVYGPNVPFYLQSTLGGDKEFRSYIPNRFTDNGKFLFTWEQRIRVLKKTLFGIPAEFWADPFFETGTVFDNLKNLGASAKVQAVGGLGLRFIVPPNVVARVDGAYGKEGYSIYTQLGYPF